MKYLIASKMTTTLVQVHLSRVAENRSRVIVWGGGRCGARRMGGGRHYYLLVTCPLSVVSPISHYEVSPWNGGTFYILRRGSTTQHKLAQTILFVIPYMKGNQTLLSSRSVWTFHFGIVTICDFIIVC